MKKVAFIIPHMLCGGVEKSLISLINEMSLNKYDISIIMVKIEGEFVELIPNNINIIEIPISNDLRDDLMRGGVKKSIKYYLKNREIKKLFKVVNGVIMKNPLATMTESFDSIKTFEEQYDIAICYHIHMPFIVRYVAEKINSHIKLAWIHNDFKESGYKVKRLEKYLKDYNHFLCVSKQLKEEFLDILPNFKENTSIANNIISPLCIRRLAKEEVVKEFLNFKGCIILTIGRLDYQKGYDMAVKVCKTIVEQGIKVKWFVLGAGEEKSKIQRMIIENSLEDNFILLGTTNNPYPYIDQCDIYVQPSRHEGYGIAVAEARVLGKPIVCTDFTGARDQLIDGETGSIVPFDELRLSNEIIKLIENKSKRDKYSINLLKDKLDTKKEVNNILSYLDRW